MGEYAEYNGERIKIGTCEQMYYLRADQANKVTAVSGSVDPIRDAEHIRFRFPFPHEDGTEPGMFSPYDYGLGLYGIEPPEDIEHDTLQFSRTYPQSGGILLSTPCPRSAEGKKSGLKFGYNGYTGSVHIHSQRLVDGKRMLVMRCGDCGALYRLTDLDECKPVLDVLEKCAQAESRGLPTDRPETAKYYREVARRIVAGYTQPNAWTKKPVEECTFTK
jgi:hypothetical protein